MGVYVFSRHLLKKYLELDEQNPNSDNDFGKNVLPAMLDAGEKMFAYRFEGYWKDVGTIDSLWEANMDLLDPNVPFDLADNEWRIFSRTDALPPHYLAPTAKVQNSLISEGGNIAGEVDFSVIFSDVTVEEGAVVRDSILMPGCVVRKGAEVHYAILAENVTVDEGAVVGARPETIADPSTEWGVAVVAQGLTVGKRATVGPKAMIEQNVEEVAK